MSAEDLPPGSPPPPAADTSQTEVQTTNEGQLNHTIQKDESDQAILTSTAAIDATASPEPETKPQASPEPEAKSEASPEPEAKPKKRLTLQERLALAAKTRAKAKTDGKDSATKEAKELKEIDALPLPSPLPSPAPTTLVPTLPNSQLMTQLAEAKKRIAELESASQSSKQWEAKLKAKDEQIDALMAEGQALSKKELKLNETIKKLRVEARDHNQIVEDLQAKLDDALTQLAALEDVLKVHKFTSIDDLISAYTQQLVTVAELTATTDNASQWQTKHRELQAVYDEETAAHRQKAAALENARLDADMARQQHQSELKQRDYRIAELQQQVELAKREQQVEISRLELKIEALRLASEQSDPVVAENAKLASLQAQYDAAQENWKLLELRLLAKIDHITQEHDALVKSKAKVVAELKHANVSIAESAERQREAETQVELLQRQVSQLESKLNDRNEEVAETKRKLERVQQLHAQDRKELALKLEQAEEKSKQAVAAAAATATSGATTAFTHQPSIEDSFAPMPSLDGVDAMPPPESPEIGRLVPITPDDEFDLFSRRSLVPMGEDDHVPRGGHAHIQMINKMALLIRQLEVELATLKDDNARLAEEKDAVLLQLLDLLKQNQSEENPTNRIAALEEEVAKMKSKELTLLEVLGEKTEQVEELRADIVDLKELCKLQVQQMIELQEKK